MKYPVKLISSLVLTMLCSCTLFTPAPPVPAPLAHSPKTQSQPVGKNWQVMEETPQLSDENGRLPFQTEKSLQPEGTKSAQPGDNRKIETTR